MQQHTFVDLTQLARVTGLPAEWLRREADGRRLPCLKVGRRRMFDIEAVRRALAARADIDSGSEGGPARG